MTITHRAFFGDGERAFTLTDPMIAELERLTATGIGSLFLRLTRSDFRLNDLTEVIRLGLIGGGTSPEDAARMVETYARHRPITEVLPLALDVLDARWNGTEAAA
ncbi:gene transfer agent family protein [Paracoccus rhizosphaerae]|uniref:Gene transfer agent family protein n=1 Tax=Paracoccus rhizosphaerae TaxID=1133347 RepID=A0ABV6CIJ3_9RHOB|nr:gene transfer agent family protein [Paracoccus rhizosphaerae]